jgi:hypothetical protein
LTNAVTVDRAKGTLENAMISLEDCIAFSGLDKNEYITANGGTVVSIPFLKNLRLVVSPGSPLAAELLEFGYSVHHAGPGTTIAPNGHFVPVDIVEITLG